MAACLHGGLTELGGRLPGLEMAARTVGSPQIRNRGTVGGNLGAASPAGDCHPPLLAAGAEIEVASLALGDQIVAEWLPLLGITYDPKGDLLEIALDGLDHMIRKPREVYADSGNGALRSFKIIDADGVSQIILLREPLMLAPPTATG